MPKAKYLRKKSFFLRRTRRQAAKRKGCEAITAKGKSILLQNAAPNGTIPDRRCCGMNDTENYHFYKPYLTDQEQVLWTGMPEKGRLFTGQDFVLLPFGIVWLAFSLFWEVAALKSSAPLFSSLFGLPFIGIGVYLVFGVFIQRLRLRGRTFYAITNKKS